jgi:serine/threonine protein kinase
LSLSVGQKLGPYEIVEEAGAGGMGEIYKANDPRLNRTVAIKVLPSNIAGSPELKERFEREAKAISSLNHAHICTLYDIGNENGVDFLVMEFLEGETLSERLSRGPIPYEEMLQISIQIASGLDAAHNQGLIHRDLKPGNIMLTSEGAKLLDFGLAKLQLNQADKNISAITQTTPLTGANTILGTMQYMAPEQLEGKEADVRTDIFSFGAIMYEMATGKRAFEGSSNATLIASIIGQEPISISAVIPTTPPVFERLVRKCLSKEPRKRWQSVSDLSDELRWISQAGSQVGLPAAIAARRKFKFDLARVVGLVFIITTLIMTYLYYTERTKANAEKPIARYMVNIKQGLHNIFWPRISPDGQSIAFHAVDSLGINRIWIRPIKSMEAYPLLNTENAKRFIWSPDGTQVAFFVNDKLKRIPISGGQPQLISQGVVGSDGCWSTNDMIVFDGGSTDSLKIVSAGGGVPRVVTIPDTTAGEQINGWPWFLPDAEHFIFTTPVRSKDPKSKSLYRIKLGSIDTTSSKVLYETTQVINRVEYDKEGYILFVSNDNLIGLPFDAAKLEVTGEPKPIAMSIGTADNTFAFSVSNDGTLLYQTNNQSTLRQLTYLDRTGKVDRIVGQLGRYTDVSISPDQTRIAYSGSDIEGTNLDIWVYDLVRNVPTRLSFDPAFDVKPIWSKDGKYIYFGSNRGGVFYGIYRKPSNGLGDAELVYSTDSSTVMATDITPDDKELIFREANNSYDIGVLSLADNSRIGMFANSSFFEGLAKISPNGKYVAYTSDESGNAEVYVRRFDGTGGKWQISNNTGWNPLWKSDGTELYYMNNNYEMMAVKVKTGGIFEASNPVELFKQRVYYPNLTNFPFDVTLDGKFFLLNMRPVESEPGEIIVVQNWYEEFRQ